jgi:hypothetical protein
MTLRCREGDLALIVRSRSPERAWGIGRVVRVVRLVPPEVYPDEGPAWMVSAPIIGPSGEAFDHVLDACLRPIRPDAEPVDVPAEEGVTC